MKNLLDRLSLNDNDVLISFDVVSLFTNIPVDISKSTILERWFEIEQDVPFTKETFIKLFDTCVNDNNYFKLNNNLYKQLYGLAMGNPLSPILADIVLEKLLNVILPRLICKPSLILKYVDDFGNEIIKMFNSLWNMKTIIP